MRPSNKSRWNAVDARGGSLLVCAALIALPCGCRATPTGFLFAVVGDTVTELDARRQEQRLLGLEPASADERLGKRLDELADERSGDRFLRYPVRGSLHGAGWIEDFYLLRLDGAGKIADLQRWIGWSDGLEDTLKLAAIEGKIVGHTAADARAGAHLPDPLLVFRGDRTDEAFQVFDRTNFTHLRPRVLVVTVGADGICRKARYFGVAGGGALRRRNTSRSDTSRVMPPDPPEQSTEPAAAPTPDPPTTSPGSR
ncbi:MAG: hypothetical protein HY763_10440 [Planctomycetes bacterium]|nr:hypothetical protein [Planctomycetota bacterium]